MVELIDLRDVKQEALQQARSWAGRGVMTSGQVFVKTLTGKTVTLEFWPKWKTA